MFNSVTLHFGKPFDESRKLQSPVNFLDLILYLESLPWLQFLEKSVPIRGNFFAQIGIEINENHLPLRMVINFDCDRIQVPFLSVEEYQFEIIFHNFLCDGQC